MVHQEIRLQVRTRIADDTSGGLLQTGYPWGFHDGDVHPRDADRTVGFHQVHAGRFKTPLQRAPTLNGISCQTTATRCRKVLQQWDMGKGLSLTSTKVTTLQNNLDQLIPGLAALLLTILCMVVEEERFTDRDYLGAFHRRDPRSRCGAFVID